MKLDRNVNSDGLGKYALINLRTNRIEWGGIGEEGEFFVIKLKDRHAKAALRAYSKSIQEVDPEFANEVFDLSCRAGDLSRFCKDPD